MADTALPDPDEIRRQLIALVQKKGRRKQQWSLERPTDWCPAQVRDEWGAFTDPRAWELILQWLDDHRPIETKEMTLNNGNTVWVHVMVERLGDQTIYVKLEIMDGGKFVFGWSFHPSDRPASES